MQAKNIERMVNRANPGEKVWKIEPSSEFTYAYTLRFEAHTRMANLLAFQLNCFLFFIKHSPLYSFSFFIYGCAFVHKKNDVDFLSFFFFLAYSKAKSIVSEPIILLFFFFFSLIL